MSAEYFLGSSEWAAARLRLQHELTKSNLSGHVFDPVIPALRPGAIIADIACGTGVWLLDAIDSRTDITAEGSDVVLDNVPPKTWLPDNISFRQLDILEPLPDELVERYDVVNAQFASSFIRDAHIAQAMENLIKMLKPGGHLQITDSEVSKWTFVTSSNDPAPPAMTAFYNFIGDTFGGFGQWTWLNNVEQTLAKSGLEGVVVRRPKAKLSTLQPNMTNFLLAQLEAGEMIAKHPVLGKYSAEQKVQREAAVKEARELGTGLDFALVRCCGRKPL